MHPPDRPLCPVSGVAAGVPFVAVPPSTGAASAPVVFAWHMMDPPRTEAAFAAALPLHGLDAWRIYLGLPLSGSRLPPGGAQELMRLGQEDAVLNLHGPVTARAAAEFEEAFADLRVRLDLGGGPVGVVGGSVGAAVAQLVLAESDVVVAAAVLISPLVQLRPVVDSLAARFGLTYRWSEPALAVARRIDFVARVEELARRKAAVLVVVGGDDDVEGFRQPAARLRRALDDRYGDAARADLLVVEGMGHALASEPGDAPAPQAPHAAIVDRHAVAWLRRHLGAPAGDEPSAPTRGAAAGADLGR